MDTNWRPEYCNKVIKILKFGLFCFANWVTNWVFPHVSRYLYVEVWITRRKRSKRVVTRKKRGSREEERRGRWCEDCEEERQGEELLSWLSCLINGTWCWAVPLCSVNQSSSLYVSPLPASPLSSSVLVSSFSLLLSPPFSSPLRQSPPLFCPQTALFGCV